MLLQYACCVCRRCWRCRFYYCSCSGRWFLSRLSETERPFELWRAVLYAVLRARCALFCTPVVRRFVRLSAAVACCWVLCPARLLRQPAAVTLRPSPRLAHHIFRPRALPKPLPQHRCWTATPIFRSPELRAPRFCFQLSRAPVSAPIAPKHRSSGSASVNTVLPRRNFNAQIDSQSPELQT